MRPYYEEDGITIYHGDCREILPQLGTDAILTDPPYGVGAHNGIGKYGRIRSKGNPAWDVAGVDLAHLPDVQRIIWGGNYFHLPQSRMFLLWDKGAGFAGRDFAECEQAWCSWDGNARIYRRDPLAHRDYVGKEHPTEKPIPLMQWCVGRFPNPVSVLADPYLGSGSTLVAAKNIGMRAIGIELEERYCEIAAKRLSQSVLELV
jgi:DNA modification methylase